MHEAPTLDLEGGLTDAPTPASPGDVLNNISVGRSADERHDRMTPKPQAGILNRPPEHVLLAAYTLQTPDPATTASAIEQLRELLHREQRSLLDPLPADAPKDQAPAETGELGFTDHYDRYHLTVTVGFGAGAYDKLGTAQADRPQDLRPIPWADLGDPDASPNGDLIVQVCTDSLYVGEHVLRRIDQELGVQLAAVWTVMGHQRHTSRAGRTNKHEGRALIGFLDGTSNLDPRRNPDDRRLVFVDPDACASYPPTNPSVEPGVPNQYAPTQPAPVFPPLHERPTFEPAWTREGSYMAVRASVFDSRAWDKRPLGEQENAVGRFKLSGQPLDVVNDPNADLADPQFGSNPADTRVPVTAHIRKANPRGPGDADRRIFRRGYPLIASVGHELQRGLVFICFGRTITTQFEFITRAWTTNSNFPFEGAGPDPLRSIEQVLCGGYFFVPPLTKPSQPWSFALPPKTQDQAAPVVGAAE